MANSELHQRTERLHGIEAEQQRKAESFGEVGALRMLILISHMIMYVTILQGE
jgi:hypothetical protein